MIVTLRLRLQGNGPDYEQSACFNVVNEQGENLANYASPAEVREIATNEIDKAMRVLAGHRKP